MSTNNISEDRISFPRVILATFVVGMVAWVFLFMVPSFISFYDEFERIGMLDKTLYVPETEAWFDHMTGAGYE